MYTFPLSEIYITMLRPCGRTNPSLFCPSGFNSPRRFDSLPSSPFPFPDFRFRSSATTFARERGTPRSCSSTSVRNGAFQLFL